MKQTICNKSVQMKSIIFLLILLLTNVTVIAQNYGSWREIDSMNIARVGQAMVVLPNGNVLVSGSDVDSIQSSSEIYDIVTGKWRYTNPMNIPRYGHHMVLLDNGEVLTFGGNGNNERSSEIFNPVTEKWRMTDSTIRNADGETVVKLKDGRVMVIGGGNSPNSEIYNPATEKWTVAAPMLRARTWHAATVLNNGNVLVSGGFNNVNYHIKYCELYIPGTDTWIETDSLNEAREKHSQILLNNGNVLLVGGESFDSSGNATQNILSLLYNVQTGKWQSVGKIGAFRDKPSVFIINSQNIFIIGGNSVNPWEIYNTDNFASVFSGSFPISLMLNMGNIIQLKDGNVLVSGGLEDVSTGTGIPALYPSKKSFEFDIITGINIKKTESPSNFILFQNYPNPFNPSTNIKYSITKTGQVSLKVYDSLGREVKALVEGVKKIGTYSVKFNARDLASGFYIYQLKTNGKIISKKMILLK